jgi:hypothetical protein
LVIPNGKILTKLIVVRQILYYKKIFIFKIPL